MIHVKKVEYEQYYNKKGWIGETFSYNRFLYSEGFCKVATEILKPKFPDFCCLWHYKKIIHFLKQQQFEVSF